MMTDISDTERRKVFEDIRFITLTDMLPRIFHSRLRLHCSTCLLLFFAQDQHAQDQYQNGALPGTSEASAENQMCDRL